MSYTWTNSNWGTIQNVSAGSCFIGEVLRKCDVLFRTLSIVASKFVEGKQLVSVGHQAKGYHGVTNQQVFHWLPIWSDCCCVQFVALLCQ